MRQIGEWTWFGDGAVGDRDAIIGVGKSRATTEQGS
jgi:hypothetical protein